jgi:phospholipase A-2-activating protein
MAYIDQIVAFIERNSKPVTLGSSQEEFVDPFTGEFFSQFHLNFTSWTLGASRYRSSDVPRPSVSDAPGSGFDDPFTGNSRYRPALLENSQAPVAQSAYEDPFTGASRYQMPSAESTSSLLILPAVSDCDLQSVRLCATFTLFLLVSVDFFQTGEC